MKRALFAALVAAIIPGAADAQPKSDDGIVQAWLYTFLTDAQSKSHYQFKVYAEIHAPKPGANDALRVDWKQKGKVLATARCPLTFEAGIASVTCESNRDDDVLTAHGDVQAELTYIDDSNDKEYPFRTLHLKINRYWEWTGMGAKGKTPTHVPRFQIVGDELLGSSKLQLIDRGEGGSYDPVAFHFWASATGKYDWGKSTFRCSVDGKRIEKELTGDQSGEWAWVNISEPDLLMVEDRQFIKKPPDETTVYRWMNVTLAPNLRHRASTWKPGDKTTEHTVAIEDHPGKWSCELRQAGKVLRELRFTVNTDGTVALHPEQQGDKALWMRPGKYFIETYFPTTEKDFVFAPDAIKKGGFFGRPWKDPASLAGMFGALPKAKGSAVVKPPKGAK